MPSPLARLRRKFRRKPSHAPGAMRWKPGGTVLVVHSKNPGRHAEHLHKNLPDVRVKTVIAWSGKGVVAALRKYKGTQLIVATDPASRKAVGRALSRHPGILGLCTVEEAERYIDYGFEIDARPVRKRWVDMRHALDACLDTTGLPEIEMPSTVLAGFDPEGRLAALASAAGAPAPLAIPTGDAGAVDGGVLIGDLALGYADLGTPAAIDRLRESVSATRRALVTVTAVQDGTAVLSALPPGAALILVADTAGTAAALRPGAPPAARWATLDRRGPADLPWLPLVVPAGLRAVPQAPQRPLTVVHIGRAERPDDVFVMELGPADTVECDLEAIDAATRPGRAATAHIVIDHREDPPEADLAILCAMAAGALVLRRGGAAPTLYDLPELPTLPYATAADVVADLSTDRSAHAEQRDRQREYIRRWHTGPASWAVLDSLWGDA